MIRSPLTRTEHVLARPYRNQATDTGESGPAPAPAAIGLIADDVAEGGRSLAETVADAIVNAVAQGHLQPGQRLIEVDLASQLNVSRVPVREAIKILQAQGILKTTPNQGTRVASFDAPVIDQVIEARLALERIAARGAMATYRRDPRRLDGLREIVSRMERAARWSDWVELRKLDVAFHHEFCRASGNEIVLSLWQALARRITIIFGRELASEQNFPVVIKQHQELIAQFEAGAPDIEEAIESHILRLRHAADAEKQAHGDGPRSQGQ
jgi:DNA-binding GntR family transcriptional regulator